MKELTNEDIERVMDYAKKTKNAERDQLIMALSIKTGMTTTDIAQLKISDVVDCEKREIKMEMTIGKRVVLLNTEVRRLAESYLTVRFSRSLVNIVHLNTLMSDGIFKLHLLENQKRGYFDEWTLPTVISGIYRAAGLKNTTPACGRTTYIRRLAKQGLPISQMTELTGLKADAVARYLDHEKRDVSDIIEMM